MIRKRNVIIVALIVVAVFFFTIHYLLKYLPTLDNVVKTNSKIENAIYEEFKILPKFYKEVQQHLGATKTDEFLENVKDVMNLALQDVNVKEVWKEANSWPSSNQLTNISSPSIGKLMYALKHAWIIHADIDTRGTQLKLLINLMGDQQCVFKPKWYDKEKLIEGPVYSGKDRYGSEIVAFYLSVLLEKPLTPVSVERTISLRHDILPVATRRLVNTSFVKNSKTCIYGKCLYCKKEDPICGDAQDKLTGAVIFNVKKTFSNYRSPWQRTYKKSKLATWQTDPDYCKIVRDKLSKKRIQDLIDTAIFDFLIQNGDRHHYETLDDTVVWVDNGKGLGNPHVQHIDILAPLYQCCTIRQQTWKALLNLAGGNLSKYLRLMPDIENILTESHLKSMEERLLLVFAAVEFCKKKGS
ncbi:unnamed protein product [Ceutorhynchus assimilis]|uniref:FAM20 C-terminal domain-containing protein n=1 Tax=Ceutorhynchus assimilis TaxID=467358 RepID=A0A9N9QCA4_9CUCU|nr:unnamed protein product [Ceutorhynchus assimilis]